MELFRTHKSIHEMVEDSHDLYELLDRGQGDVANEDAKGQGDLGLCSKYRAWPVCPLSIPIYRLRRSFISIPLFSSPFLLSNVVAIYIFLFSFLGLICPFNVHTQRYRSSIFPLLNAWVFRNRLR